MHTIKFASNSNTGSRTAHYNLYVDGEDVGVLYLNENEKDLIINTLKAGSTVINNIRVEEPVVDLEDEIDLDPFDD